MKRNVGGKIGIPKQGMKRPKLGTFIQHGYSQIPIPMLDRQNNLL